MSVGMYAPTHLYELYGGRSITEVTELRHYFFCAKKGKVESVPSMSSLFAKHIARTNYQAYIWRKCLEANPEISEPEDHGWKLDEEKLVIDWMSNPPAPDVVLEFFSCSCTCASVNPTFVYIVNRIRCAEMCRLG